MLITVLAAAVIALAAGVWIGSRAHQRALAADVRALTRAAASAESSHASIEQLDSLPARVARYLRWAIPEAHSMRLVRIRQRGTLRTDVQSDRWMPFEAEHLVTPSPIGFLWNARVTVAPLLHVRVRDAYIDGSGSGHVSLMSAFRISAAADTPEINSGSLHRFLAEAVWCPVALLPSPKLRWSAIDANSAVATLTDHDISVSLEFRFAERGEVTAIYTPARWGTFGGKYEQKPWEGHFRDYERRNGFWVPREGDVGWYVDDEWRPVWKGTVLEFDVGHQAAVRLTDTATEAAR